MGQVMELASTAIVSEVIEGEAIIMDMRSGSYYSAEGIAALVWDALLSGADTEHVTTAVAAACPVPNAAAETARFIETLQLAGLLVPAAATAAHPALPDFGSVAYKAPVLSSHDDLRDLILLDPIHDVDDTGWPTRKDSTPARITGIEKNN